MRASVVSDVHVLAQNMLHHAERRRLLVFADNRQDAAFQAGWMRDHARRFRMRALMMERIAQGPVSVGDTTAHLDRVLEADDDLSRALIPEVWNSVRREAAGGEHARERGRFLRILVLREITTGVKQRVGLEPWGRIIVDYQGLEPGVGFIQDWARRLSLDAERLADGIRAILDGQRRSMLLLDREGLTFSRFWMDGDLERQRGYLPSLKGVPKGLKLRRDPADDRSRVSQWLSERGDTAVRQAAKAFGVEADHVEEFVSGLWTMLTEELDLLAPVTLVGARGNALPGCAGVRQLDADRLLIREHRGRWRCGTCQRTQVRPTPNDRCLRFHCDGTLVHQTEDPDDYDLVALEQGFAMLRPAEHSAQVPADERERLENQFKGDGDRVNTLVATPTLEMGVDIGSLDTVLLRNVPPLPANYWQRVGRAGRRHRLAVSLTYARPTTHDRAYFDEPLKLLSGRVAPPRFNLRNELMVRKHVHATVLTHLNQLAREGSGLGAADRVEVREALDRVFPSTVTDYLFDENREVRGEIPDLSPLHTVVTKHRDALAAVVGATFRARWPEADADVVGDEALGAMVLGMTERLAGVVKTLKKRLDWALSQMRRLHQERERRGVLDPDEDALYRRCEELVRRLKGTRGRRRQEAEGYDDVSTFGVLAAEGFLPGYGLEIGSVLATAVMPRHLGRPDFYLPRPPALALREYVPGNLIYANGHRFVARAYHFDASALDERPVEFQLDTTRGAVREIRQAADGVAAIGVARITAVRIGDVELAHVSHITDDEEYRFQMPVAVAGYELGRHGRGRAFRWGARELLFRRGLHLRLVNYGAATMIPRGRSGYPVCLVDGQSRSPLSSQRELDEFFDRHEERDGQRPGWVGFYTDAVADVLTLQECADATEAYSVLETLRIGMAQVLEMEREDLDVLVIAHPGAEGVDAVLFDPMPGGSGLIDQALARWPEVIAAGLASVATCPSACERSCIDCLQTFRNAFFHKQLDRSRAVDLLRACGDTVEMSHEIPERMPPVGQARGAMPVNEGEQILRDMLDRAGLAGGVWHHQIQLGLPLGTTSPDVFFPGDDEHDPGLCVYLDGLSEHIHGNPLTAARDRQIRESLRVRGYGVLEVTATELHDRDAMTRHFSRIGRHLGGPDRARQVRSDQRWFGGPGVVHETGMEYDLELPPVRRVAEDGQAEPGA